jgi:hypothetical protein
MTTLEFVNFQNDLIHKNYRETYPVLPKLPLQMTVDRYKLAIARSQKMILAERMNDLESYPYTRN